MLVREARQQAREWVGREASRLPGFAGAFLAGSTKWKSPDEVHGASSDVDVRVVVERAGSAEDWKKARFRDILVEASVLARAELGPLEEILPDLHLSASLWHPVLLADPTGALAALGERVTAQFARRRWVEERRRRAQGVAVAWLERADGAEHFLEQATCWLFGASATTLPLLAAGLRNPTVRRRYAESRALLEERGLLDFHEEMLAWLGCADMRPGRAREHLATLAVALDATGAHVDPTFRFAADLRPDAWPIALEGSRELIDAGLHREAVFWLVATFSRCLQGLRSDAPVAVRELDESGLRALLRDLGIESHADVRVRADHIRAHVPRLEAVAREIIDGTPEIDG